MEGGADGTNAPHSHIRSLLHASPGDLTSGSLPTIAPDQLATLMASGTNDDGVKETPRTAFPSLDSLPESFTSSLPSERFATPPGRVLLVDDDPDILTITSLHLEVLDLQVEMAQSGKEALAIGPQFCPNAIVLDLDLPDTTGHDVCRALRRQPALRDVPIVFLSANEGEAQMLKAYEQGADDYMIKPFNPRTFSLKLNKLVKRHQQRSRPMEFQPGQLVAEQYIVERELGRGGAGIVYLVKHRESGQPYALKTISQASTQMQETQRLTQEIKVLSDLQHPHLVPIVAHQLDQSPPFYMMPYYPNGSLAARLAQRGALSLAQALAITRDIAKGLHQAHERGILHRDIKTDNVMFTQENEPVLTDFGLALQLYDDARITQTGVYTGTPKYMSPDQINYPTDLDARSDVFSLGLLLFEMVTGQSPFQDMITSEIMVKLTSKTIPSPRQWISDLPVEVEQLCRKALRRDRDKRFQSALELAQACDNALSLLAV